MGSRDLTVLILTHDRPHLLATALEAVRLQTYAECIFEVLVSDNGAERMALHVLKEYQDLPIRYLEAPLDTDFCGHAHFALSSVRSPFLAFLHDDDWWHPGHLQASMVCLESNPDVAYAASASLWVESELSTAPPFYFNFDLLPHLVGVDGIAPRLLTWDKVMMLSWIYTPFHLSTLVGRTALLLQALDVWEETNYLVDRLYYATLAQRTCSLVAFLPFPSGMVRLHESQVTNELAGSVQSAGVQKTVSKIRELARLADLNLNRLWRAFIPELPHASVGLLTNLARECLLPEDLNEMGCPNAVTKSPWAAPSTGAVTDTADDLKKQLKQHRISEERHLSWLAQSFENFAFRIQEEFGSVKWLLPRDDRHAFLTRCKEASTLKKKRRHHEACKTFHAACVAAVDSLERVRKSSVGRFFISSKRLKNIGTELSHLQDGRLSTPSAQKKALCLPVDKKHYSKESGLTFDDGKAAASHYENEGWRKGFNPHPLFKNDYFLEKNPGGKLRSASPWSSFQALLAEGKSPEAHPRFTGQWLREYFLNGLSDVPKELAPIPNLPADELLELDFSKRSVKISIGIILFNNSADEVRQLFEGLEKAVQLATEAGNEETLIALTDNSHQWTEESLGAITEGFSLKIHFSPTSSNVGFGGGHNHLMRFSFGTLKATHYLCLNPDGYLDPQAIVELHSAIRVERRPALIEGLQFPSEHPKEYDAATFETGWCSAACLIIPQFLFDLTGGFDERFFMYCEDVDLSWRVWEKGYRCKVAPQVLFHHRVESRTNNPVAMKWMLESGRILAEKWGSRRFRFDCEKLLVERGCVDHVNRLPSVATTELHLPHRHVDFSHYFSFAAPRW